MNHFEKLKEEFEDVKKKYEWTKNHDKGHFIVPKKDMEFFVDSISDCLDYLLDQKLIKIPKESKVKKTEKKPTE